MSSNKITTTEPPIKSLEIKTKEEEKKLFKDDVLDKFNFWIYVAFVLLGLILIISFILLIYSIFSSSSSSSSSSPPIKPPEPPIIIPKVNINPNPIQIPLPPPPPPPPQPILKKVEEPKPSFFSSLFGNTNKPSSNSTSTSNPTSTSTSTSNSTSNPTSTSNSTSNSNSNSLPKLNTSSNNNSSSIFSRFTNLFSPRTNIPKPTDTTKITGGKYIKRYKNNRYNNK